MRTFGSGVVRIAGGALAAVTLAATSGAAQQRDRYTSTIYHGTGLVTIPVAWVSPTSSDIWVTSSGKTIPWAINKDAHNFASYVNTNLAMDTHWMGRFSVGASYYSQNPDYGIFGQAMLLRAGDVPFLPSVAVGVRNVGNCKTQDRFFAGCDIALTDSGYRRIEGDLYKNFSTRGTLYGVATKEFGLGALVGQIPGSASFSVGYGNGTFREDGGLGDKYNSKGTIVKGLFLGSRFVTHPSINTSLTFMAENDGWDYNAGIVGDWRGLTIGVYGTELEQSGTRDPRTLIYNYRKLNASFGYSGNIVDISRGVILRSRITSLTREEQRLRYEIANRERRVRVLEVALRRAQAGELAEMDKRRKELDAEVSAEREAIRQANERLRQIEQQQRGGTPPAPAPTPTPPQQ